MNNIIGKNYDSDEEEFVGTPHQKLVKYQIRHH